MQRLFVSALFKLLYIFVSHIFCQFFFFRLLVRTCSIWINRLCNARDRVFKIHCSQPSLWKLHDRSSLYSLFVHLFYLYVFLFGWFCRSFSTSDAGRIYSWEWNALCHVFVVNCLYLSFGSTPRGLARHLSCTLLSGAINFLQIPSHYSSWQSNPVL